jgi:hypothetical protein
MVDHLQAALDNFYRAALFAKLRPVSDNATFFSVFISSATVVRGTRRDVNADAARRACEQAVHAVVDNFHRAG